MALRTGTLESALKKHWVYAAAAMALLLAGAGLAVFLEGSAQDRDQQIVDLSIPPRADTDEGMRRIPLDPGLTGGHAESARVSSVDSDE